MGQVFLGLLNFAVGGRLVLRQVLLELQLRGHVVAHLLDAVVVVDRSLLLVHRDGSEAVPFGSLSPLHVELFGVHLALQLCGEERFVYVSNERLNWAGRNLRQLSRFSQGVTETLTCFQKFDSVLQGREGHLCLDRQRGRGDVPRGRAGVRASGFGGGPAGRHLHLGLGGFRIARLAAGVPNPLLELPGDPVLLQLVLLLRPLHRVLPEGAGVGVDWVIGRDVAGSLLLFVVALGRRGILKIFAGNRHLVGAGLQIGLLGLLGVGTRAAVDRALGGQAEIGHLDGADPGLGPNLGLGQGHVSLIW